MQTQNTVVLDNDIDVAHKINTIELDNWINHLKYIKKELTNLINLCNTELILKLKNDKMLKRLEKKQAENEALINALNK